MKSRVAGAGLGLLCSVLAGSSIQAPPATARASTLIAQQSEFEVARELFLQGTQLFQEGSVDSLRQAISLWQQAIPLLQNISNPAGEAATLNGIGFAYDLLSEKEKALEYYNQALPLMRETHDKAGEATTLSNIGLVYNSLGEQERALEYYNQALSLSQVADDPASKAATLSNIGLVHSSLGEQKKAIEYFDQALQLFRETHDKAGEAAALNNIGGAYYLLGEIEQVLDYYNQALPLSRAVHDRVGEGTTLNNIGAIYDSFGEIEQALDYYNQALSVRRMAGDRVGQADTLNNIGLVYNSLGEKERALDYYNQSLPLRRDVLDREGEAITLSSIGLIYDSLGEKEQALDYYNQSLLLSRAVYDQTGEAATLSNIGLVYSSFGEQRKTLEYFNQSLSLFRAASHKAGEANTLSNIGDAYSWLGEEEQALEYLSQALPLSRAIGDRNIEADTLLRIAAVYREQDKLSKALSIINEAIILVEDLRLAVSPGELRTSYFATVQDYYQLRLYIQMQLGQSEAAFETSEASRARLLLELLNESKVDIRQGVDPTLLAQEQLLQQEIAQLEQRRISLRSGDHTLEQAAALDRESDAVLQQLDQVIAQIRRNSPAYADIVQPQPLSLAQIQQQVLDTDTALVQYELGKDQSYLWLVTKDHFQAYILPDEADIQAVAKQFQSAIANQGTVADVKRIGDELVTQVLPEQPEWLAGKRLLVAGDGILSELPFAALPLPNQTAYKPLLAEHEVLSQPSITAIAVLRQQLSDRPELPPSLAVLADPVYRADDERLGSTTSTGAKLPETTERNLRDLDLRTIERLPHTRTEANSVSQLAKQNGLKQLSALDFEANADWVKAPALGDYSIVHLATHGFINPVNPQLSGLVLSLVDEEGQSENGFLRLHDIFNLDLAAELVVLSACQTGRGEEVSGEGIVGLSRGFMYAGAERVAVSLWNVNDEATAALMSEFYRYMLEEEMTPPAAMRAAQLDAWQTEQSPSLWAAFTLQGEWQP